MSLDLMNASLDDAGSEDYPAEVAAAAKELWDGSGSFVFTSSGGVYAPAEDGQTLTESSPLGDGPQQMKLVQAEKACRDAAGTALRFSGLYSAERGAHSFWIAKGEVQGRPDSIVSSRHLFCLSFALTDCDALRGEIR
jgi:nucleoside-diphosphate-sugar epimerase